MEPMTREAFRRHLRALTREEFAAFVAALWAARGATTRVDGSVVHVRGRDGARERRVLAVTGARVPADVDGVDAVALAGRRRPLSRRVSRTAATGTGGTRAAGTAGSRSGVEVFGPERLHEMLLYAVPRAAAAGVCERFFDRPLVDAPPTAAGPRGPLGAHSATLVVGLLGAVLVVAGLVGSPLVFGGESAGVFGAPDSAGGDPSQVETPSPTPTATPSGGGTVEGPFPPGIDESGIVDADRVADGHAQAVTGRSYRLTLTHREFVGRDASAYRRETVSVASPTRYLTTLEGAGTLNRPTQVIAGGEAYADGEIRYERRVVADEYEQTYTYRSRAVRGVVNGEGRYADRVETYLTWFLTVDDSELVDTVRRDGTRYYWIRLGTDPYPAIANSSGSVLVDETGVVHEVRRRYEIPREPGVSVAVTIRYTDVDATTVEEPVWLTETGIARQADGTNAPEPTGSDGGGATNADANATRTPAPTPLPPTASRQV